jgi:hypothetical protein
MPARPGSEGAGVDADRPRERGLGLTGSPPSGDKAFLLGGRGVFGDGVDLHTPDHPLESAWGGGPEWTVTELVVDVDKDDDEVASKAHMG